MAKLFSYGTLQLEKVQQGTFGRILIGNKDKLKKYTISYIKITNPKVIELSGTEIHPIIKYTGSTTDFVKGTLFDITDEELTRADDYEVNEYKRTELTFDSGIKGFIYLKK